MKNLLLLLMICLSLQVLAQAGQILPPQEKPWLSRDAECLFPSANVPGTDSAEKVQNIIAYLKVTLPDLKNEKAGVILAQLTESPFGSYYTFDETCFGRKIFGAYVKLGLEKNGKIISVISKTLAVDYWETTLDITEGNDFAVKTSIGSYDFYSWKPVWYYNNNAGVQGYEVEAATNDGKRHDRLILDAGYQVIMSRSLIKSFSNPDSLVTMYVFYPDPLTTAMVPYAEPYTNHNDSDVAVLDAQMVPRTTRVSVLNDSFYLENPYLRIQHHAYPYPDAAWAKKDTFRFKRNTSGFRDIMVYYHAGNYRNHLKELGYDKLGNKLLVADPQIDNGDDSNYNPPAGSQPPTLSFGLGGIPDAEDADVIYHEFSHFLSDNACKDCSVGFERNGLDEGLGDYFAASFSKSISTYNWQKVYNWDGNNKADGWYGRSCASEMHYPEGLKVSDSHFLAPLWSSALMQIWDSIGRTKTDILMLETLYSLGQNISMTTAAKLFLKNDSLIYHGADAVIIAHYFIKRGFLPEGYIGIEPAEWQTGYKLITNHFSQANTVILNFDESQTGALTLYDITGKLIVAKNISVTQNCEITAPAIANGIYILSVNTNGLHKSFKIIH